MRMLSVAFVTVALAAVLAGCVVGDGDVLTVEPPLTPCALYPDDIAKCWLPWSGHIVQTCVEGDSVITRLHFDRPSIPDSLRANILEMGDPHLFLLHEKNPYIDTIMVCDGGGCRELVTEFSVYDVNPQRNGTGTLRFWEPENYADSLMSEPADGSGIAIDSVWRESCP